MSRVSDGGGYMDLVVALANGTVPPKTIPDTVNRAIVGMDALAQRVANNYRRYACLTWNRDRDDLCQIVREVAAAMLRQLVDQTSVAVEQYPANWEASLVVRARSALSAYADSSAVTGVGRYTSASRRQRSIAKMREKLPMASDAELLTLYNDYVAHARKDPLRQSAFATEADLVAPIRIRPTEDSAIEAHAGAATLDSLPERLDYSKAISRCIQRCRTEDPGLGAAATCWFHWWPDDEPLTIIDVARQLRIPRRQAAEYVSRIKTVMSDELRAVGLAATDFGAAETA